MYVLLIVFVLKPFRPVFFGRLFDEGETIENATLVEEKIILAICYSVLL